MTFMAVTVTPEFVQVSTDTLVAWADGERDPFHERKLIVLERRRVAVVGTGSLAPHRALRAALEAAEFRDVVELDRIAPRLLGEVVAAARGQHTESQSYQCVIAGWDAYQWRPAAFVYSDDNAFRSHRVPAHACRPEPDIAADDYPALASMWVPATQGVGTEAFHVALARNARRAHPAVIGGELHTARIDHKGVHDRVACDLS